MAPAPKLGDEILLPLFDESALGPPSTVTWSQGLSTRTAPYYAPDVDNITTGEQVQAFFIAAELYKPSTTSNPKHITKVGTLVPGGELIQVEHRLPLTRLKRGLQDQNRQRYAVRSEEC